MIECMNVYDPGPFKQGQKVNLISPSFPPLLQFIFFSIYLDALL